MDMATSVIIPARNEEATIGPIIHAFQANSKTKNNVFVAVDGMTTDNTAGVARHAGGIVVECVGVHGKGEVVAYVAGAMRMLNVISERIILCDADYHGFTKHHVKMILAEQRGMVIGVPEFPDFPETPVHVSRAWPLVSGFRYLPGRLIPENAHGYLLETQLNQAAYREGVPIRVMPMPGLRSPFRWPLSPRRMAALQRDRVWGKENGIL
jgi:glycosyltransferase involved in cell wall biosynthesis